MSNLLLTSREELNNPNVSEAILTYSARVETPDGTMFVHIMEEDNRPVEVKINIGKTGTAVRAWSDCVAELISLGMQKGANIYEILAAVCGISGDKLAYSSGIPVTSGPDGVAQAILIYFKEKEDESYASGKSEFKRPFFRRLPEVTGDS